MSLGAKWRRSARRSRATFVRMRAYRPRTHTIRSPLPLVGGVGLPPGDKRHGVGAARTSLPPLVRPDDTAGSLKALIEWRVSVIVT
jgi:hypothetical protein